MIILYGQPLREGGSWRGPVVVLAEWGGVSLGDQASSPPHQLILTEKLQK